MIDYIIVGGGLAGIAFAELALQKNRTIYLFDNDSQNSSTVAAGLYNPVILKRFTGLQFAQDHLDQMNQFYDAVENKLNHVFRFPNPLLRRFASIEEQNNWFHACDNPLMAPFLSTNLLSINFAGMSSPHGFGEVRQTGYIDTKGLLKHFREYLTSQQLYSAEKFEYDKLIIGESTLQYNSIQARHIIFAEGFGVHSNPYFHDLPVNGTKGELLVIHASGLKLDRSVNAGVFFIPLGNDHFKVGATYDWDDKTATPTEGGLNELVGRIADVLECEFTVVAHLAGVRPTTRDRKPIIGKNPKFNNMYILNGLGTRGAMLGPAMAKHLYELIEDNVPLPKDIDVARCYPSRLQVGI